MARYSFSRVRPGEREHPSAKRHEVRHVPPLRSVNLALALLKGNRRDQG
jgi:hypothetical protein